MLLERILGNWKTTVTAILALAAAIGVWVGTDINTGFINQALTVIYGILLLFAKD